MEEEIKVGDFVRHQRGRRNYVGDNGWITYRVLVIVKKGYNRQGIIKCCSKDIDFLPDPLKAYLSNLEHIPNKKSKRKHW